MQDPQIYTQPIHTLSPNGVRHPWQARCGQRRPFSTVSHPSRAAICSKDKVASNSMSIRRHHRRHTHRSRVKIGIMLPTLSRNTMVIQVTMCSRNIIPVYHQSCPFPLDQSFIILHSSCARGAGTATPGNITGTAAPPKLASLVASSTPASKRRPSRATYSNAA